MKKFKLTATALLATLFMSTAKAEQTVELTTSKTIGETMELMVNPAGTIYIDWGDGTFVEYQGTTEAFRTIKGEVQGTGITIKGSDTKWTMLNCSGQQITKINTKNAPYLKSLYCSNNAITSFVKSYSPSLKDLDISNNSLRSFAVSHSSHPDMENLNISENNIATNVGTTGQFTFNGRAIQNVNIANNKFKKVNVASAEMIDAVNCGGNSIQTLNFSENPSLTTLLCADNSLTSVTGFENECSLQTLVAYNNQLTTLDLAGAEELTHLNVNTNELSSITLPERKLITMECAENKLTFGSLPLKKNKPANLNIKPQATIIVTGAIKTTGNGVPYIDVCPSYSDRNKTEYVLNIGNLREGPGHSTSKAAIVKAYVIDENGNEVELSKATSTSPNNDYSYGAGKLAFFAPQRNVYLKLTHSDYPELELVSDMFCVGESIATGVENITTTNTLEILAQKGLVTLNANQRTLVVIYNMQGQLVWNGIIVGSTTVQLPSATYIINGQKISL
jgi:hypothetical protein